MTYFCVNLEPHLGFFFLKKKQPKTIDPPTSIVRPSRSQAKSATENSSYGPLSLQNLDDIQVLAVKSVCFKRVSNSLKYFALY